MTRDREAVDLERDVRRLLDADHRLSEDPGLDSDCEPVLEVRSDVSDEELDLAWRDFKDRSGFEPGGKPGRRESAGFRDWLLAPSWSPAMVLGMLVVLAAGLGVFAWQQDQLRETAIANPRIVDLLPDTGVRGSSEQASPIPVAMDGDLMVLVIQPEVRQEFPQYEVEILNTQGEVIRDIVGVERTEYGSFQVAVWRTHLPEPPVRLRLFGISPEGRETLGRYTLDFKTQDFKAP